MRIVETYWAGVLKRLQAEVDNFNQLISHQGEKGRENEHSLARILERLIPRRYGVGSGLLIDANGNQSQQMDIIVFEKNDDPTILAQTNQVLYPIESVKLCIEVKTTADSKEWQDCKKKKESIARLTPVDCDRPPLLFFAYQSNREAQQAWSYLEDMRSNNDSRPDAFCVLELGLVGGLPQLLSITPPGDADFVCGVAPLHDTEDGTRKTGKYLKPQEGQYDAEVIVHGSSYPVVKVPSGELIAEPSRALLLFCDALLVSLSPPEGRLPVLHHYITDLARDLLFVSN